MSLKNSTLIDCKRKEANKILGDYELIVCENRKKKINTWLCGITLVILAGLNFVIAFLLSSNNFLELLVAERIKMRPGLLPMEDWKNPKGHMRVHVHVFSIENPYNFQNGIDKKLKLKQIGPIIYKYNAQQTDIVFEDDGTLSYSTLRNFEFLEDENEPRIMNKTITVINPLMLTLAAKSSSYFIQNLEEMCINRTIYNFLWNITVNTVDSTKFLGFFKSSLSYLLPTDNYGYLYNIFKQYKERYNVRIGPKNSPHDFWKINTLNGRTKLHYYNNFRGYDNCPFSVVNATDGTGFSPYITKKHEFKIVIARMPRYFTMEFQEEVIKDHINTYKFVASKENLMRTYDSKDCLGNYKNIELPSGVIDASILTYDSPIGFSMPHFCGFNGTWETYLEGLSPNKEKHQSYLLIEPYSGLPLGGQFGVQNVGLFGDLNHLPKLRAFSNKIVPILWIQIKFKDFGLSTLIYFCLYMLPVLQIIVAVLLFFLSVFCFYLGIKKLILMKRANDKFVQIEKLNKEALLQHNN